MAANDIMPIWLNLPLFGAVLGWSRETVYGWAAGHVGMVARSDGRNDTRVAVTTVEALLGRTLWPADLARGLAVLERRRRKPRVGHGCAG
jgi:hypothetical protein